MTLKRKEKFYFLVNFMVANAIVILTAQALETFIIATHFVIKNAPPSNYNKCQDQSTTKFPPKMLKPSSPTIANINLKTQCASSYNGSLWVQASSIM